MENEHLTEIEIMQILSNFPSKKSTLSFFSKENDKINNHLLECPKCLIELWECFLSKEAFLEKEESKLSKFTTAKLTLSAITNTFNIDLLSGWIFPLKFAEAKPIRAEYETTKKNMLANWSSAIYKLINKSLPGIVFNLKVTADIEKINFDWHIQGKKDYIVYLSYYLNNKFTEKQSISSGSDPAGSDKVRFIFNTNSKTKSIKFSAETKDDIDYVLLEFHI